MASFRIALFGFTLFLIGLLLYGFMGFLTADAAILMVSGVALFLFSIFIGFVRRHPVLSAIVVAAVVISTYLLLTLPVYVQPASPQNPQPQPGPAPCFVACLPGAPGVGAPSVPPVNSTAIIRAAS